MAKKKSKSNNNSKSKATGHAVANTVRSHSHPDLKKDQEVPAAPSTVVNTAESEPVPSPAEQDQSDPKVHDHGHSDSVLQDDPRLQDAQSPWASVDSGLGAGQTGRMESIPKHRDEEPLVETSNVQQETGSRASLEEFRPFSERAPPRRYEDHDDDHEHYHNEQAPLIRTGSNDSYYNNSGPALSSTHTTSAARRLGGEPPLTWAEWVHKNGLHPRAWTRQTYIKAGLLATLLTLIILSFTVFRIQDHIKDILR